MHYISKTMLVDVRSLQRSSLLCIWLSFLEPYGGTFERDEPANIRWVTKPG